MTYEEKVRWLRRYQESLRREQELAEEVERLQSEATRITPLLSGMPGGPGDGQKLSRAVESVISAKEILQGQIVQCEEIRREVIEVIESVCDQRENEILRRRYLLGQQWEKVGEKMGLSSKWVRNIHRTTLEFIDIKEKS